VYSNTLFAVSGVLQNIHPPHIEVLQSIEATALWQFAVATTFVFPKLLLHVFIGSRIAALSDGDQRSHMDTRNCFPPEFSVVAINIYFSAETKIVNGLLIGGGISIAVFTSW
jgi:hypothetical protein